MIDEAEIKQRNAAIRQTMRLFAELKEASATTVELHEAIGTVTELLETLYVVEEKTVPLNEITRDMARYFNHQTDAFKDAEFRDILQLKFSSRKSKLKGGETNRLYGWYETFSSAGNTTAMRLQLFETVQREILEQFQQDCKVVTTSCDRYKVTFRVVLDNDVDAEGWKVGGRFV